MEKFIAERKASLAYRRETAVKPPVTVWYMNAYTEYADRSPVYREACAWHALLSHIDLPLYPEENIVGNLVHSEAAMFYYGAATYVVWEFVERYIQENGLSQPDGENLRQKAGLIDSLRYKGPVTEVFPPEEMASIEVHAASSTWFGGHMVLDYDTILSIGLRGYEDKIKNCRREDKAEFYDAMDIMLTAVRLFIRRYAEKAESSLGDEGWDADRLNQIISDLRHIADYPPVTFRQALQLVWMLHMLNGSDSFGRFDQYTLPFYERDIACGRITHHDAQLLLVDFMVKVEEVNQIQNMTIGGVDAAGFPAYSDLTEDILNVARMVGYKGPNLALRVTENMPENIWTAALSCIGTGIGVPALYNDGAYIDSLVKHGFPREEANNFSLAGCSQVMIPGKCNFYNDVGMMNAAKIFELALYNGKDPRTGIQAGPCTGEPQEFVTFEDFYAAFLAQVDYFCALEGKINNREAAYRSACEGYTMRTLFIGDCVENGQAIFEGGARYNNIELEIIGLTNAADSLYAVKQVVFEEKYITMRGLADAVRADYDGMEELCRKLCEYDKFGNDIDGVDNLRTEITNRFYQNLNAIPASLGGIMVPGEVIFTAHDYEGAVTGATPDGRKAYTVLADSAGSSQGMDREGPTALLNSILKIPTKGRLLTSVVTNLKFTKALYVSSVDKIRWMIAAFFGGGGMQLQINVVDRQTLLKAVENPDEYRSLIVRVGGYSDYFVNLSPALQQEIINRTQQTI